MQTTDAAVTARRGNRRRHVPMGTRLITVAGWTLIGAGTVILLYIVYTLFYTNVSTDAAQSSMLDEWAAQVGDPAAAAPDAHEQPALPSSGAAAPSPSPSSTADPTAPTGEDQPVVAATDPPDLGGEATALLRFVRPGSDTPPVHADPLVVVNGVGVTDLKRGPGHYPDTAMPGEDGNFAVAGHRTTYGSPFLHLDELREGDEIHVTDRSGETFVYRYRKQRIVAPGDTWVIGEDPFGTGVPTLTLTTCHPRFSARQRLIAFAELVDG